jgi:hypothetical protein
MASAMPNLPQQPFANGEPDVAPAPQYNQAPAHQYSPGTTPMAAAPQTAIASTNTVSASPYGNVQAAAWQATRGIAQ